MESKLINGDSLEVLKDYEDNSIDLLCTDPPYGYGFMGKSWDKTLPPRKIFEECLRVLKPGSFTFVMSAPRGDVQYRMIQMLDEVGFEVGFTPIYWAYATGFPKAMNIGKAVDKRGGQDLSWFIDYILKVAKEKNITKKELSMLFPSKKTGKPTGWLWNKQKTQGITLEQYNKIKDFLKLPFDTIEEAEREVVGKKSSGLGSGETYAFTDDNDKFKGEVDITIPKTDKAKELDGSYAGFQPKPAVEVVIVAMKPLDQKGYVDQALHNGKGVTWLDSCRIPFSGMDDQEQFDKDNVGAQKNFDTDADGLSRGNQPVRKTTKRKPREENTVFKTSGFKSEDNDTAEASPLGRFAANLLVSDDVLNDGKNYSHGKGGPYIYSDREYKVEGFIPDIKPTSPSNYGDGGSFSRYFSLDAWWENRVSKLPEEVRNTFPFLVVPKASKSEKNMGLEKGKFSKTIGHNRFDQCATCGGYILQNQDRPSACKCENPVRKDNTIKGNFHPTVKPFQLFSYLVTLGSRKDDVVLDPFAGSGTTGISCVFEDRKFICIEREKEYFDIMESRIEKAKNPTGLVDHEFWE